MVFWRENCASAPISFDHVSYSVFGIARDLFYWELIFCVFCYSYSEIGINGIVPKERALTDKLFQCIFRNISVYKDDEPISTFMSSSPLR